MDEQGLADVMAAGAGFEQLLRVRRVQRELARVIAEAGPDPLWLVSGWLLKEMHALLQEVQPYTVRRKPVVRPPWRFEDLAAPLQRALLRAMVEQQSEGV